MSRKILSDEELEFDEYLHGPTYRFFRSFFTHFFKIMLSNLAYVICNIPAMLVAFAYSLVFLPNFNSVFIPDNFVEYLSKLGIYGNDIMNDVGVDAVYQLYYLVVVFTVMFLVGSGLICIGPFQAGFYNVYKNLIRGNGVSIFDDFKEGVKRNWKQSTISMIVSLILTAICLYGIGFYANHFGNVGTALSVIFIVIFCVFTIVQNMANYMIVCIDLPLRDIYKNAILFVFIRLITNIFIFLIYVVLLLLVPFLLLFTTTYFAYAIAVILFLTLTIGFCQYLSCFMTNEMINTFIVPKAKSNIMEKEEDIDVHSEDSEE